MINNKLSIIDGEDFERVYAFDNCLIVDDPNSVSDICAIYFSSSGIYYPNTIEEFRKAFVYEDRYEWYETRLACAARHVFVRDVSKQFYITGINNRIDCIDKLIEYLRTIVKNYRIITVGASAGAYAATIIGIELKAEMIFCFSGYFNLKVLDFETWPYIRKYWNDCTRNKWFDIHDAVLGYSNNLFYFYPKFNVEDSVQSEFVANNIKDNMHIYRCDSDTHGIPIGKKLLRNLFSLSFQGLRNYFDCLDREMNKPYNVADYLKDYKRVIVFGAGKDGEDCIKKLKQCGYSGEIIVWDNSNNKIGTLKDGIPVEFPAKQNNLDILIIVASRKYEEVLGEQIMVSNYAEKYVCQEEVFCGICHRMSELFGVYR